MKKIFLICSLISYPIASNAADRFSYFTYLRGGYMSSFNVEDSELYSGDFWTNKSVQHNSYFGGLGVRMADFIRLEANYTYIDDNNFELVDGTNTYKGKLRSDLYMLNLYLDARDKRISKFIVPYIGFGFGLSYNKMDYMKQGNTEIAVDFARKNYVYAAMAGLGFEFSKYVILDLGYQYRWTESMDFELTSLYSTNDFVMASHNLLASLRIEF